MEDLQKAGAGIARVEELFAATTHLPETGTDVPAGRAPVGGLRRVALRLSGRGRREIVLEDLDLHLGPGRVLGILGRTGSGKSTLARLLTRLYDPVAGAIEIGGVDLRHVTAPSAAPGSAWSPRRSSCSGPRSGRT